MPKGSPLNRYAKSVKRGGKLEQPVFQRKTRAAVRISGNTKASVGRISNKERAVIRKLRTATRIVATPAEARNVVRRARNKAKKS